MTVLQNVGRYYSIYYKEEPVNKHNKVFNKYSERIQTDYCNYLSNLNTDYKDHVQ